MERKSGDGRLALIDRISGQLATLVAQVEIAIKNNLPNINVLSETIMAGVLNRMYGWDLRNANAEQQNFPGVDLVDGEARVAVQVTSSNTPDKVDRTIGKFTKYHLDERFDRLILLVITKDNPTDSMKKRKLEPWFSGNRDIWNMPVLLRKMMSLDTDVLEAVSDWLSRELDVFARPAAPRRPAFPLPAATLTLSTFVEGSRDRELEILEGCLGKKRPVFIWGLGGIGKTQVAKKLAERWNGDAYIMHYAQNLRPDQDGMRETILQAEFEGYLFSGPENADRDQEFKERFKMLRTEYKGAMIIIDGFDRPRKTLKNLTMGVYEQFEVLAREGVQLVFTTRSRVEDGLLGCEIQAPAETALLALMRQILQDETISDASLLELIRAVDGHTLTVDLMARTLKNSWGRITPQIMLRALGSRLDRDDFPEVLRDRNEKQQRIYGHLCDLFQLSSVSESGRRVMKYATLLPEEGLDETVFIQALDPEKPEVRHKWYHGFRKRRAAEAEAISERDACVKLADMGWLSREGKRVFIHPVIRTVCVGELEPDHEECRRFLDHLLTDYTGAGTYDERRFNDLMMLFNNVKTVLKDGTVAGSQLVSALWNTVDPDLLKLHQGKKLVQMHEQAVPADRQALAFAYLNLAEIYRGLNEDENALETCQKALDIWERERPAHRRTLAAAYDTMAECCKAAAKYQQEMDFRLKGISLWEELLGVDTVELSEYYLKLADTCRRLGNFQKGLFYAMKTVTIREAKRAEHESELAVAYHMAAMILLDLGKLSEARQYAGRALDIGERIFWSDSLTMASLYGIMQLCCAQLGDYLTALDYGKKNVRIREGRPNTDPAKLAVAYHNIASTYMQLCEWENALFYQERALSIEKSRLPKDHPDLAHIYSGMGIIYTHQHDYENAVKYAMEAIRIREKMLPADHPELATAYGNLSTTFDAFGEHAKALEYALRSMAINEKALPPDHPDRASAYGNVGAVYEALGQREKAMEYKLKALKTLEKVLPPNHPKIATAYNNLGSGYTALDEFSQALEYHRRALAIYEKTLPSGHSDIAASYHNVGTAYANTGDHHKALENKLKALEIREKILPPDHPDLAWSYKSVSATYFNLEDYPNALAYGLKAQEIYKKILPPDHPDLVASYYNMGVTCIALEDYRQALEHHLKALEIREKAQFCDQHALAKSCNAAAVGCFYLEQYEKALEYAEKAMELCLAALPAEDPFVAAVRENLEQVRLAVKVPETAEVQPAQ